MDIIKFITPTSPTKFEFGEIINGLTSKMWIERYRDEGEFTLVAPVSTGMRTKLPIGTFISHIDTLEMMRVENHEISQTRGENADIVITGRSYETYLENRIVGANKVFPSSPIVDYILSSDYTWNQAVTLISDHILASILLNDQDALYFTQVLTDVVGSGEITDISIKRGDLYTRLIELLNIDNLGIKTIRPGPWSDFDNLQFVIHKGIDKSNIVTLSNDAGEIESADYLWSNKKLKNAAIITGRWVEVTVVLGPINLDRRTMFIDASDIDNSFSEAPTGGDLDNVIFAMQQRGYAALASQNDIALTKVEVSKNNNLPRYRIDYNVGDLVTAIGDFQESATKRVSEYVEIEDETGQSGYPTLTDV